MSTKRINDWNADSIAHRIAKKAFAHIMKPFEDKLAAVAKTCYDTMMQGVDVKWLLEHGFAKQCKIVWVEINDGHGEEHKVPHRQDNGNIDNDDDDERGLLICPHSYSSAVRITSAEHWIAVKNLYEQMSPYEDQCEKLKRELAKQINGKTVTQACKAWPAAANIINGQMGVEAVKQMDVPLEQLLGKFLLALPAPEAS